MRRLAALPVALGGAALIPGTASAEIVKAPTGEKSWLKVNVVEDEDAQEATS